MLCKGHYKHLTGSRWIVAGALIIGMTFGPRVVPAVTVSDLVAQAKQEGALNATCNGSISGETIAKLSAAFKKRFGLDIKVTIAPTGEVRHYPKAIMATRAKGVPTYDSIEGSDMNNTQLIGVGGAQRIENWESLLAEINPLVRSGKVRPQKLSREPFTGLAFQYLSRLKTLIYNTKLISKEELPKTHAELGHPRYKDKFVQPPFVSHWDVGLLAFPDLSKKKWLEIIKKAGKNSGLIGFPRGNVNRVLLGEYPFALANAYNLFRVKHRDPQAPIGHSFFKDYNAVNSTFYIVRKRARHPAAGTLFALWMGTPEAEAIWQADIFTTQYQWGESKIDGKVRQYLKESGAKTVSFLGSEGGVELLKWFGTQDGRNYSRGITQAIRGN